MSELNERQIKFTFSGHESFQCRQLWLKKGYDYVKAGKSFNAEDAVFDLGVGKNMVAAIKFWLKAFNVIDQNEKTTEFADLLLGENGFDEYLEDDASLWLLHYHLIKSGYASTYSIIFNELRREKVQFNRENYLLFIKRKAEIEKNLNFNKKTIEDDFDVFRKMYIVSSSEASNVEESYAGLLSDLGLLKNLGKGKEEFFYIENMERESLPKEILFYAIFDNGNYGKSINLRNLEQDYDSPGSIFALNRAGLVNKIIEATETYDYITYTDQAGVKELQIKSEVTPFEMIRNYYEK